MIEISEYPFWIALGGISGIFTRRKNDIVISCCHEQGKPLSCLFNASDAEKVSRFNLNPQECGLFNNAMQNISKFSFLTEDLLEQGYGIIPIFEKGVYPQTVKDNLGRSSPVVLYYRGDVSILSEDSVAIVGSRKASAKSLEFADLIAKQAVESGHPTVSGYAAGVDRQALDSSIKYGGKSIVVLPQGIMTFSSGFKALYREIISGRVVITSAFYPTAPWSKELAMARNPIIYAFAKQIYVAESSAKGGTYSGVENGLKKGRTIFVRYPDADENNANLLLIKMGCKPVYSDAKTSEMPKDTTAVSPQQSIEDAIVQLLKRGEYNIEEILGSLKLECTPNKLSKIINAISGVKKTKHKNRVYYYINSPATLF